MDNLLFLLLLVSFVCLILGLISPRIVLFWVEKKTRGRVLIYYGTAMIVFFISFGFAVSPDTTKKTVNENQSKADISKTKEKATFGALEISNVIFEENKVKVTGKTDLPDGAKLNVDFDVAGRSGSDTYIGVNEDVVVNKQQFYAELIPPKRPEFNKGVYVVEVLFTPRAQTENIIKIVGKDGEKLSGENVKDVYNIKTLEISKEFNLNLNIKVDFPMVNSADYSTGTPEKTLSEFLTCWKNRDWDKMVKFSQITWRNNEKNPSDLLDAWFGFKDLMGAKISNKSVVSNVCVDITVQVYYAIGSDIETKTITARIIKESEPYKTSINGEWGVNPTSVLKEN